MVEGIIGYLTAFTAAHKQIAACLIEIPVVYIIALFLHAWVYDGMEE